MIRWGLLLLGLASIALGITGYLMHPPIAVEAESLTVSGAVAVLGRQDRLAVVVDAEPDLSQKFYSALSERPYFTRRPTSETYRIDPFADPETLNSYLGNRVRVEAALGNAGLSIGAVTERILGQDELRGERKLAPVAGTGGRVWVLSPFFNAGDGARDSFGSGRTFEGLLTRLHEIEDNASSYVLDLNFEKIEEVAFEALNLKLDSDTLVILTGDRERSSGLYRVPVSGSQGALWVSPFYEGEALPAWTGSGPIEGVLWSWKSDGGLDADLERLLGSALPERYGVIHHDETASELNAKTALGLKLFTGLGGGLLLLGLIGFARRRRSPEAQPTACMTPIESTVQPRA